jgi:hypothetical protein
MNALPIHVKMAQLVQTLSIVMIVPVSLGFLALCVKQTSMNAPPIHARMVLPAWMH